jgi:hypothetical protein
MKALGIPTPALGEGGIPSYLQFLREATTHLQGLAERTKNLILSKVMKASQHIENMVLPCVAFLAPGF